MTNEKAKKQLNIPSECGDGCGCSTSNLELDRRTFLSITGAGAAALSVSNPINALGGIRRSHAEVDHFVPEDKQLTKEWLDLLTAKGSQHVYRGNELTTLGMPCGGIAAGQLYVTGDGSLAYWWIMNNGQSTGAGGRVQISTPWGTYPVCYDANPYAPPQPIDQGFAIRVGDEVHQLNKHGFDDIGFVGEYPIATIQYGSTSKQLPVQVSADVFSPFIPLSARESAYPATILRYSVENTSDQPQEVSIGGWLQNLVGLGHESDWRAVHINQAAKIDGQASVHLTVASKPKVDRPDPKVEVFEDFENGYKKWTIQGSAFGDSPAQGTLAKQQAVSGFEGEGLVNTFLGGDDKMIGIATSDEFEIKMPFIAFLVGGGGHQDTAVQLLVEGRVKFSSSGRFAEQLQLDYWDVADLVGEKARIQIVDKVTVGWGHINVDKIYFTDQEPDIKVELSSEHEHVGDVSLTALGGAGSVGTAYESREAFLTAFADSGKLDVGEEARYELGSTRVAGVASTATIAAGETKSFDFVLSWFFPNRADGATHVGNRYAAWFDSSQSVAAEIAKQFGHLTTSTYLFRDTFFSSTLPYWFLQRVAMPLANLATETCTWRKDGYFWAWEGVGCCSGNCGHVWNYAQGMARLFPELERSVREFQDFNPERGYRASDGAIMFRGTQRGFWAGDAMGGYILKAYREHTCSTDDAFLKTYWSRIKKSLQFIINLDGEDGTIDGLIQGKQHNTYDINYYGANTLVGALYLGALRAGAEMATEVGDNQFAERCRNLAELGSQVTMKKIWNEEYGYFVQDVDLAKHPNDQQGDGCLSDQLFGQAFAHQVGLGYLYPKQAVKTTMQSIYKYNWAPDIAPQNKAHPPERWFCRPGEAGLLMCTWPKSKHLGPRSVRYRDEVWSGTEYQAISHMLYEGMVTEGLAMMRAIHERYDGVKHNPWNEVECGDHYARALASWGCLLGISGFSHHGPKKKIGFAPKLNPERFRCFFSTADAWGTYSQQIDDSGLAASIEVAFGTLSLSEIQLGLDGRRHDAEVSKVGVSNNGVAIKSEFLANNESITIRLPTIATIEAGKSLTIRL